MPEDVILSPSKLKRWHFCHQAYYYKYHEEIVPKRKPVPLARGSHLHKMIEAFQKGEDWEAIHAKFTEEYNKLLRAEKEHYGDMPGDTERIMRAYVSYWEADPLEYIEIEGKLGPYEVDDRIFIEGKVDRLAYDADGQLWVVDTKTHAKFPSESARQMNPQAMIYVWLARQAGYDPIGILWDYIRTKPPAIPQKLKRGGLSKRKNIDTTREVYLQTIKEHGLNPKDYKKILDMLEGKRNHFFSRLHQPISDTAIENILDIVYEQGLRIREYGDNPVRELNWRCPSCDYFALCNSELYGMDTEFVRRTEYVKDTHREEADKEKEENNDFSF